MKFSEMPYKRVDMDELTEKLSNLLKKMENAQSADAQYETYIEFRDIVLDSSTMASLSYARHTIDTRDEFYDKENDFYDEKMPLLQMLVLQYYKAFISTKFRPELEEKMGKLWFDNVELELKGFDERIIEQMQQANALGSEYKKLLTSAKIDFDGKVVNLSQLRAYQLSADRDIRKSAYEKRSEFFLQNADKLDEIFDKLVALRNEMALKLGYKDFVELGYIWMNRNSYTKEDVARFRAQVKKVVVPFTTKLHEQRRKNLGIDKLMYYDEDIFFAEGNPAPKGTPEEMFENGRKMYNELSSETAEFMDFMLKNELFDALAKEGKAGGGYCTVFPAYGAPFVFANFNGTSEDVDVLTHECGHALNSYLSKDLEIMEYRHSTMDVAEIHSMAMEFFTADWMQLFFHDKTKDYLYMHLAAALIFLPYGCMVDEFQHEVYANPGYTPAQRKELWLRLEKEYRPHLDYGDDEFLSQGGVWQRQSHIYERPFYYIDYCIAQVCALQYRIWMEEDRQAAWNSYLELSQKAGSKRLTELVKEAGLVSPFEDGCMQNVVDGSSEILNELNK